MIYKILIFTLGLMLMAHNSFADKNETAIFAGGCFWCIDQPFREKDGVIKVEAGYTGGTVKNPSYEEVCTGKTGHYETVRITYNPGKISYNDLLDIFWQQIDPTDDGGQFADRGSQYRTAIFYVNDDQKKVAEESLASVDSSGFFGKPVVTKIIMATEFYPAEDYHQSYYKKCPLKYNTYKTGSGREAFIKKTQNNWKDIGSGAGMKEGAAKKLTSLQYHVTQECGTEPAFNNEFWNNKKEGIYVTLFPASLFLALQINTIQGPAGPRSQNLWTVKI